VNRDRLRTEIPPAIVAALDASDAVTTWCDAPNPLWDLVTRTVIVRLGRELLQDGGALGWDRFLATCSSPALKAVGPALPHRTLGAYTVARPLCEWFEAWGAEDAVRQKM